MLKSCLPGIALLLLAAASSAAEVEDNCARCHSGAAPVPEAHPPVMQVTVQSCGMCHRKGDGYFTALHDKHGNAGLVCASCHGDAADDELAAQLTKILEQ